MLMVQNSPHYVELKSFKSLLVDRQELQKIPEKQQPHLQDLNCVLLPIAQQERACPATSRPWQVG